MRRGAHTAGRCRCPFGIFLSAICLAAVPAAPAEPAYTEAELKGLFAEMREDSGPGDEKIAESVRALGADAFAERQTAERSLSAMFWLPPEGLQSGADAEVRYRLRRIVRRAETEGLQVIASVHEIGVAGFADDLFELGARVPEDSPLAEAALDALRGFQPGEGDAEGVRGRLGHPKPHFRMMSLALLGRIDPGVARKAAAGMLADADERVRLQAALELARSGDWRGARALVDAAGSESPEIKRDALGLLTMLAGEQLPDVEAWEKWLDSFDEAAPAPPEGLPEFADAGGFGIIRTSRLTFRAGEKIGVAVAELPGHQHDWLTVVKAGAPDTSYGQYFYGSGKTSGEWTFDGVAAGEYEVRVYHDWPNGGYEVEARHRFRVLP